MLERQPPRHVLSESLDLSFSKNQASDFGLYELARVVDIWT